METTDEHRWTQILQSRNKPLGLLGRSPFAEPWDTARTGFRPAVLAPRRGRSVFICVHLWFSLLFNCIVPA